MSTPASQHLAAIAPAARTRFEVTHRPTPTPGPDELVIEVKSIALNPIDYYQRDMGFPPIANYPAVLGSDIAGTVASAGSSVSADEFSPGTRVAAFAQAFFKQGAPDYGAFQQYVLVPAAAATPLPQKISFNEAALLPMAVQTAWSGWYSIGLARDTAYTAADKQGVLIWGASSSIGSGAVQIAKSMGFVVYATASEKHHDYVLGLGASKVFDYKAENVAEQILSAAKEDGVTISTGFDAVGSVKECLDVLKVSKGQGTAKLATSKPPSDDTPKADGVEVKFMMAPAGEKDRFEYSRFVFGVWLKEKLETGEYVPSPKIQLVDGGLEGLNNGLDELKKGVSGTKLVVEI